MHRWLCDLKVIEKGWQHDYHSGFPLVVIEVFMEHVCMGLFECLLLHIALANYFKVVHGVGRCLWQQFSSPLLLDLESMLHVRKTKTNHGWFLQSLSC